MNHHIKFKSWLFRTKYNLHHISSSRNLRTCVNYEKEILAKTAKERTSIKEYTQKVNYIDDVKNDFNSQNNDIMSLIKANLILTLGNK